jgi:inward rectifier potassium channel
MEVRGLPFWRRLNIYHSLLSMSRWKFLAVIILFFLLINLCLRLSIYILVLIILVEWLPLRFRTVRRSIFFQRPDFYNGGLWKDQSHWFCCQSYCIMEALIGLMSFALVTGLLYGRFARPRAYIRYSKNALFVPFRDSVALMFRMVPYTKNYLLNVEVKVTLALKIVKMDR